VRREGVVQVIFSGVEGKVSYKQFITHMIFAVRLTATFPRLFPIVGSKIITEASSLEDSPCPEETSYLTDADKVVGNPAERNSIRKEK
jgi:hypothetical protein